MLRCFWLETKFWLWIHKPESMELRNSLPDMTPVLCDLHWLPVRQRITFKAAVLMFKYLHDMAPVLHSSYRRRPTVSRCQLAPIVVTRSVQSGLLTVLRTSTNYGDRSFAVHGPRAWNSLPAELRSLDTLIDTFRHNWRVFVVIIIIIIIIIIIWLSQRERAIVSCHCTYKVIGNSTIRYTAYEFLSAFHSNCGRILYHFRNKAIVRTSRFFIRSPAFDAPVRGSQSEYCHPITFVVEKQEWRFRHNRLPACDRWTDGQTSCDGIVRAIHNFTYASRVKTW